MTYISVLFIVLIIIVLVVVIVYLWKSILNKWKKYKVQTEKILLEDILKHLYHSETGGRVSTIETISRTFHFAKEKTEKLILQLSQLNLLKPDGGIVRLSDEGKSYALRIIRVHRLWEKFLAENTSVNEKDWHYIAENKEHQLDENETRKLAAQLGNPIQDPHGDPIPLESGEYPKPEGISLNDLPTGYYAKVVHIEDEPAPIYSQLRAQNIHLGMQIKILEKSEMQIRFDAYGEEYILAPILASNIHVLPFEKTEEISDSFQKLSSLNEGEVATIVQLSKSLRGQQRRRILDFGIVPGTKIKAHLKSLSGDPTAYLVRGTLIALRKDQSDNIYIRKN